MLPFRSALALAAGLLIAASAGTSKPPTAPAALPAARAAPALTLAANPSSQPTSDIPLPTSNGPILRGTITDESGNPVKGVKVQLYSGCATRWEGQSATTGDDGVYLFDPLKTGSMIKNESTIAVDGWDLYIGIRLEHDTHVPKEGESWFDITVPNVDGNTIARDFIMSRGGVLDGEIKMTDGFAWPKLDLRFMPVSGKGTHWYATTDRKGRFSTKAMVAGEYSVQWNSPQADYAELARITIEPGKQTSVSIRAKITVAATAESTVND